MDILPNNDPFLSSINQGIVEGYNRFILALLVVSYSTLIGPVTENKSQLCDSQGPVF